MNRVELIKKAIRQLEFILSAREIFINNGDQKIFNSRNALQDVSQTINQATNIFEIGDYE